MTIYLQRQGYAINHKRVQRLMQKMDLQAIYPKPKLSKDSGSDKVYPYLLRDLAITRPNQVWSTDIFNTDQAGALWAQFTSRTFTDILVRAAIQISMDGKGRALDNILIERLWRSVKYEDIYLNRYDTVPALVRGLDAYFSFFNYQRPHQSLGYQTPAALYKG